jgi:hypothetical protein
MEDIGKSPTEVPLEIVNLAIPSLVNPLFLPPTSASPSRPFPPQSPTESPGRVDGFNEGRVREDEKVGISLYYLDRICFIR